MTSERLGMLGAKISEWRAAKGLRQADLAEAVQQLEAAAGTISEAACSSAVIAHIEAGIYWPSVRRLCAIAEALGSDASTLLRGIL